MSDKKYNPTWDGYLGDFLSGNVGINQIKPQHEYFDAIGLEKVLNDNTQYHLVLTLPEAHGVIEDITRKTGMASGVKTPQTLARGIGDQISAITNTDAFSRGINPADPFAPIFKVTDPISTYAGNIRDSRGLYDAIMQFKKLGIAATAFTGDNGIKFIHLIGLAGLKRLLTGTRYIASNPNVLAMSIGSQSFVSDLKSGIKFCIVFSLGYRILESIFKADYTLEDFITNITMDMTKLAVASVISYAVGVVATAFAVTATAVLGVAFGLFLLGIFTVALLDYLDNKYGISAALKETLKKAMAQRPRTPEADFQGALNKWGAMSR